MEPFDFDDWLFEGEPSVYYLGNVSSASVHDVIEPGLAVQTVVGDPVLHPRAGVPGAARAARLQCGTTGPGGGSPPPR